MSDTDGFIEEVTEEVRRDRFFMLVSQALRMDCGSGSDPDCGRGSPMLNVWRKAQANARPLRALGMPSLAALKQLSTVQNPQAAFGRIVRGAVDRTRPAMCLIAMIAASTAGRLKATLKTAVDRLEARLLALNGPFRCCECLPPNRDASRLCCSKILTLSTDDRRTRAWKGFANYTAPAPPDASAG